MNLGAAREVDDAYDPGRGFELRATARFKASSSTSKPRIGAISQERECATRGLDQLRSSGITRINPQPVSATERNEVEPVTY